MKNPRYLSLEFNARFAAIAAWNIFAAQGGHALSMDRKPLPPLLASLCEIADRRLALAGFYQSLHRMFPLGLSYVRRPAASN